MNYRHAFHAGNFADLVKHATLTLILDRMIQDPLPMTVIDTHAGAGAYDLAGESARRSAEAAVDRLLASQTVPEAFDLLIAAVVRANPGGGARVYPGSPALVCAALRPQDRFIACELRADDYAALAALLEPLEPQAFAEQTDGFALAATQAPSRGRLLVLIDPPFERGDDYRRIVETCRAVLGRNSGAVLAIWTPLKDLDTFDRFLSGLEGISAPRVLVGEARLRPLVDPMRLNGCAMVVVNASPDLDSELEAICRWIEQELGDGGNEARVWRL